MDEPCSALDPIATKKIEDLIKDIRKEFTVVIVTHNMQQAARVSDYTAFMLMGKLVEFNETKKMFENPDVTETERYVSGKFGQAPEQHSKGGNPMVSKCKNCGVEYWESLSECPYCGFPISGTQISKGRFTTRMPTSELWNTRRGITTRGTTDKVASQLRTRVPMLCTGMTKILFFSGAIILIISVFSKNMEISYT